MVELPQIEGLYTAPLGGYPVGAMGYFQLGTRRTIYYSDGSDWFFEADTGRPAFCVSDGAAR